MELNRRELNPEVDFYVKQSQNINKSPYNCLVMLLVVFQFAFQKNQFTVDHPV